jgi:hypothetical protein
MSSVADCPAFIAALDGDKSIVISSHNSDGEVEFISKSAGAILGWAEGGTEGGVGTQDERANYKRAPYDGSTFFRPHADASRSIRFQNIFYSKADTGCVYSVDKVVEVSCVNEATYVLVDPDGLISAAKVLKGCDFFSDPIYIGRKFWDLVTRTCKSEVAASLVGARKGRVNLNIQFSFPVSGCPISGCNSTPRSIPVTANFYPRTDGSVVVILHFMGDISKDIIGEPPTTAFDISDFIAEVSLLGCSLIL